MARANQAIMNEIAIFAEAAAAKDQKTAAPDFSELGSRMEDLEISSDGILADNSDIDFDTFRKMRYDPQVKACLLVLKLPLLQLDWNLNADTDEGQEISRWCQHMLQEYMDDSMEYYLREMLTALDFGRSITEKVWQLKSVPVDPDGQKLEDRIIPLKLKTYDPKNIKIKLDPNTMKLIGAVQKIKGVEKNIPADKLLIYSHEKEFNNYNGESVLRAAYKPWIIKEFLQKFWNIALERYGSPLASMELPQGGSIKKAITLMDMVKSKSGIPLPEGYKMTIHNLANAGMSFKEAIEYQDVQIARAMLIPDLVFANSGTGAYALSKTHAGFFEMRLNGISQEIGDIFSKYLIKPMIQYNYGEVREYPSMKFDNVGDDDLKVFIDIVDKLIKGKVVAPTEAWIREKFGLPAPDNEAEEYLEKNRQLQMEGMDNIMKANQVRSGQDPDGEGDDPKKKQQEDPKNISGKAAAKDNTDVKKDGKDAAAKFGEMDDAELADYYSKNLGSAVRGLLKLGIGKE